MEWLNWLDKEDKYSGMTAKQRKIQESIDNEKDSDNQYYTKAWESWLKKESTPEPEPERDYLKEMIEQGDKNIKDGVKAPARKKFIKEAKGAGKRIKQQMGENKLPLSYSNRLRTNIKRPKERVTSNDLSDLDGWLEENKSWESWLEKNADINAHYDDINEKTARNQQNYDHGHSKWQYDKDNKEITRNGKPHCTNCDSNAQETRKKFPKAELKRMVGTVRHDGKDKDHAWNINPKGHIIDGSRDQFGDEKKIHIIKPNDKKHKEYTTNEAHLRRTPDHLYGRARKKLNRQYERSHNENLPKRSDIQEKITAGMESLKSWESWLDKKTQELPSPIKGNASNDDGITSDVKGLADEYNKPSKKLQSDKKRDEGSTSIVQDTGMKFGDNTMASELGDRLTLSGYKGNSGLATLSRRNAEAIKSWESWLEKNDRWDGKFESNENNEENALNTIDREEKEDDKMDYLKDPKLLNGSTPAIGRKNNMITNITSKKPRFHKGVEQQGEDIETNRYTINTELLDSMKSWESWLEKVDESRPDGDDWNDRHLPVPKITIHEVKDEDTFEEKQRKLHQLSNYNDSQDMNEGVTTAGGNVDQQRVHKLLKNNATETSHKDGEKKVEWDGKFSSSTIEDEVKNEDDKAVSEEESLEELTDGELVEIEKLKSWEVWLEKDALDGKTSNDKIKPTEWTNEVGRKTTKELTVTPKKFLDTAYGGESGKTTNLMDAHSNDDMPNHYGDARHKIGHNPIMGKKEDNRSSDESGVDSYKPIERGDELGDVEDKKRKLRRGESMQKPKLTVNPKGEVIDHDGRHRARAAMEEGHETIPIEVHTYDKKHRGRRHHSYARDNIDNLTPELAPSKNNNEKDTRHPMLGRKKSWESWLEKGRWDEPKSTATDTHLKEESGRDTRVEVNELNAEIGQEATNERLDEAGRTGMFKPTDTPNFTSKKPKYVKGVEQTGDDISQSKEHLNIDIAHAAKSWEGWLEKMQGAGDARFGNQHLTGLDQKPVNNEEDEPNILPEKDEKTDDKEEKQEETDNKPYKALDVK